MVEKIKRATFFRGMFSGIIGVRRLLKFFEKYKMDALCKGRRRGDLYLGFYPLA